MELTHKGYKCKVEFAQYGNGNTAIQLIGANGTEYEEEAITVATCNGEFELHEYIVGLKTWSENEGIVESLVNANVIRSKMLGFEPTGFVAIEHYELTEKAIKELKKQKNS